MFNFFMDAGNHEERAVAHFEHENIVVDTCRVSDGYKPYETAVSDPHYNEGKWIIVEAYDDRDRAKKGHEQWVQTMTADPQPDKLVDCGNALMMGLAETLGVDEDFTVFPRKE